MLAETMLWLVFGILLRVASGVKVWQPTTDIGDVANWPAKGYPQNCDTLDLSGASGLTMRLSGLQDVKFSGLTLPKDGALDLPDTSSLTFSLSKECSVSRVAKFSRVSLKSWSDPSSWNYSVPANKWLPHTNRIPCAGETVVFPPYRGFTVLLPTVLLPSGTFVFGNKAFNTLDWSTFLQSEEGFENFQGAADLRDIQWRDDTGCPTPKQCYCTRKAYAIRDWTYLEMDEKSIEEAVCMHERPRCVAADKMSCRSPIRPFGHCCDICGAVLDVEDTSKDGLELKTFEAEIDSELKSSGSNFRYYVGRKPDGNIQIVLLANGGDSSDAYALGEEMLQRIHRSISGKISIALKHSGLDRSQNVAGVMSAIVCGSLLFVLALFGSIYYFNMVFPEHRWLARRRNYMFAKFQNFSDEDATVTAKMSRPTAESFQNPLYSPGPSSATSLHETQDTSNTSEPSDFELPPLPVQEVPSSAIFVKADPENTKLIVNLSLDLVEVGFEEPLLQSTPVSDDEESDLLVTIATADEDSFPLEPVESEQDFILN